MIQYSVYAFEQSANATVDVIFDFSKSVHIGTDACNSVIFCGNCTLRFFKFVCFCCFCTMDIILFDFDEDKEDVGGGR